MQTFLAYDHLRNSARVLDRARLGKQRVENLQIMSALLTGESRWKNHPAVKMWAGYEGALLVYQSAICEEWMSRGYKDTCLEKTIALMERHFKSPPRPIRPPWFGNEAFHAAHRSNLLRKNPEHYGQFGWSEPDNLPYIWPTNG